MCVCRVALCVWRETPCLCVERDVLACVGLHHVCRVTLCDTPHESVEGCHM